MARCQPYEARAELFEKDRSGGERGKTSAGDAEPYAAPYAARTLKIAKLERRSASGGTFSMYSRFTILSTYQFISTSRNAYASSGTHVEAGHVDACQIDVIIMHLVSAHGD